MKYEFVFEPRIELDIPIFHVPMEQWTQEEVSQFYDEAGRLSSKIPAKILELDKRYMKKYEELHSHPDLFFEIMDTLNELSGIISELNVLYLRLEGKFLHSGGHFLSQKKV